MNAAKMQKVFLYASITQEIDNKFFDAIFLLQAERRKYHQSEILILSVIRKYCMTVPITLFNSFSY
jgi:hypothetical protein